MSQDNRGTVTWLRHPPSTPLAPTTLEGMSSPNARPRTVPRLGSSTIALRSLSLVATGTGARAVLTRHPRASIYPVEVTGENAARVDGEGVRMIVWLMVVTTAVFACLTLMSFGIDAAVVLGLAFVAMPARLAVGIVLTVRAARSAYGDGLS